jgi:hypothetical protein
MTDSKEDIQIQMEMRITAPIKLDERKDVLWIEEADLDLVLGLDHVL